MHYLGNLWSSSGSYGETDGVVTWEGTVPAVTPITITFDVTVSEQVTIPQAIVNAALLDDGLGSVWQRPAVAIANGYVIYLPLTLRSCAP